MTKDDFGVLFIRALTVAAADAESRLGRVVPRIFRIALRAPGAPDHALSVEDAIDRLYLGPDRFYRIIDVAVMEVRANESLAFVRVSGHQPAAFSTTWDPLAMGPFKQLRAERIREPAGLPV